MATREAVAERRNGVLWRLAHGHTVLEIVHDTGEKYATVTNDIRALYSRLRARDRGHLIHVAHVEGLLDGCDGACDLCALHPPGERPGR